MSRFLTRHRPHRRRLHAARLMIVPAVILGMVPIVGADSVNAAPIDLALVSVDGGEALGAQRLVFERLKSDSALPLTVPVKLQEITKSDRNGATPADFSTTQSALAFAAGATTATFDVAVVDDGLFEGAEFYAVELTTADGPLTFQVGIPDSSTPKLTVVPGAGVLAEGDSTTVKLRSDISPVNKVAFTLRTLSDEAIVGSDISALDDLVELAPGATETSTTPLVALDDDLAELFEERFSVAAFAGAPADVEPGAGTLASRVMRVTDNDEYLRFRRPAGQEAAPTLLLEVTEPTDAPLEIVVPVDYLFDVHPYFGRDGDIFLETLDPETDGGVATRDVDFTVTTTPLGGPTGSAALTLTIAPDDLAEVGAERARLGLRHEVFCDCGFSQQVDDVLELVITDGPTGPVPFVFDTDLTLTDTVVESAGPAQLTVRRLSPSDEPATLRIVTLAGTADEFIDFRPVDTTVTLDAAPFQRATVDIDVVDDPFADALQLETFTVQVFHTDSGLADAATTPVVERTFTIEDDDPLFSFATPLFNVERPSDATSLVELPVRQLFTGWPLGPTEPITLRASFAEPGATAAGAAFVRDEIVLFDGTTPQSFLVSVSANDVLPTQTLALSLSRAPRFVGPQTEWIDHTVSFVITPAVPTSSIGDDIRAAIDAVIADFTSWTPQFDLTVDHAALPAPPFAPVPLVAPSGFQLPVLTGDLGELLQLGPAAGLLESAAFDTAADSLDALVLDLEANGCIVDFVAGGLGGRPDAAPGDVVQTTCSMASTTVSPTGESPLNDQVSELYQWLIDQPRTFGNLDVEGSLDASITVGVDANGPYVAGSTGLRLDMTADGSLVTSSGGDVVSAASGTAAADFEVGLRLDRDASQRVRVEDLGDAVGAGLVPRVDGTARITAQANNGLLQLLGEYDATVTTAPSGAIDVDATTVFTGVVEFELPRRATDGDPTPDPTTVEIQVVGTLTDEGLGLVGTYDNGTDLILDGFDITEARIETTLTDTDTTAPLLGRLRVEVNDGFAPIEVGVDIRIEPGRVRGTATFSDDTADLGLFRLDRPAYSLTIDTNPGLVEPALRFGVTADRLVATAGEKSIIEASDVAGSFTDSGAFSFSFAEGTLGEPGDLFHFDIGGLTIQSPDAAGIILRADVLEIPLPLFGDDTTATVRNLVVDTDLRIGASAVEIDHGAFAEKPTVIFGLLPVTLAGLGIEFTSRDASGFITDLEQFTLSVDAFVADDAYEGWPFDPVVQLGGVEIRPDSPPADRAISFSAEVDSVDPLVLRPIDLGPISLGIENLGAAREPVDGLPGDDGLGFVFDGIVTVDGYRDGGLLPGIEALFTVSRDGSAIPEQEVSVIGELITDDDGVVGLDLQVGFGFDLDLRPVIEPDGPGDEPTRGPGAFLEDFEFVFNVEFGAAVSPGSALPDFNFYFDGVRAVGLSAPFGDLFEIAATDIDVFLDGDTLFSGEPSALLMTIGGELDDSNTGASIVAGDALGPLAGWGGHAGNFGLTVGGQLVALDGFFVGLTVPDPDDPDTGLFGLPAWLPLFVEDVAVEFGDLRLDELPALQELSPELLNGIKVRVSGGLRSSELFPIAAEVDDLVVDLGKLAAFDPASGFNGDDFPIENLSGVKFGIQPGIDFGGFVVGGSLTFGEADITLEAFNGDPVPTSVLYGRIAGYGESPVISGGVDLVVTEHGPVLLKVTAPLGIPIGPTGFLLTDVTGAATFGDVQIPVPDLGRPEQLLGALDGSLPTDIEITDATIAAAITPSVQNARPTWDDGFALAVAGHLSNVAAGGLAEGDVTLAVTVGAPEPGNIVPGVQAIGFGTLEVFGIEISESIALSGEVGRAGIMFDLGDFLAPRIDLAFETPAPGSPVGLIFPARATVAAQLDLQGVPAGVQAGMQALIDEAGPALGELVEQFVVDNPSSAFALAFGDVSGAPIARLQVLLDRDPSLVAQSLLGIVGVSVGAVADTLGVIRQGARQALIAAGDEFDPSFVFAGVLQPALLGIPLGEPETDVQITIDKNNIGFVATGSIIEALKDQVGMYTLSGDLAGGLFALSTLNTTDRVTFGVQIPVPDLRSLLLDGGSFEPIDPSDTSTQFAVTIEGDLIVAGMTMSVGGFFTAPNNANFVDTLVQKRFELPADTLVDPDRVQIIRRVDYDNLIERGGLVLYGRLQVPRLVTDPVGVALSLPDIPEDLAGALSWFDEFGTQVTATEEPISATLLIPGLPPLGAVPAANEAAIEDWMDTVSLTGVLDGTARTKNGPRVARMLSMPIGKGRLVATTAGLEITASVPMLGTDATFIARVDERTGINAKGEQITVRVPVASLDATTTSQAAIDAALDTIGLPSVWQPDSTAGFSLRAYSPGFDPGSRDALQRSGGIAATATLDMPGLIDDARGEIEITPAADGSIFGPDWSASLDVSQVTVPGLRFTNIDVGLAKRRSKISGAISGNVDITVPGFAEPSIPFSAGFAADGDFTFDYERDAKVLGSDLAVDLNVTVANGALSIDGSAAGQLSIGTLDLASGTFNVRLSNGLLELSIPSSDPLSVEVFGVAQAAVSGFVRSNGAYALNGEFSTSGSFLGTSWNGTANINLATGGAISGSFAGSVTVLGINGSTTGSIVRLANGQGQVTGTVRSDLDNDGDFDGVLFPPFIEEAAFSFVLGESLPPDIKIPSFGPVPDISVTVHATDVQVPVEFEVPVATDDRDGDIAGSCDPGPGVIVSILGRTVTCSATDSSGNTAIVSFEITVTVEEITVDTPQVEGPIEVIVDVPPDDDTPPNGRRGAGGLVGGTVFSTPQPLGNTTVSAGGSITFRSVLPTLEPGVHHIVLATTTNDGGRSQVIVPLVVDANGALVEILGRSVVPAEPVRGAELPTTGSEARTALRIGLLLTIVGMVLFTATRRRRHAMR